MDLPELYFNYLAWVPAGTKVNAMPVANNGSDLTYSTLGKTYDVKYSYVCITSTGLAIEAAVDLLAPGANITSSTSPGVCSDGMNTAGLAISALMQDSSTGASLYSAIPPGPAVEQLDLINYILSTFPDVASVLAALEGGQLSVVLNPNFIVITQKAFGTNLTLAPLHYVIYDSYNQSLVIEYSGPNNLQWFNNTLGVLANNPLYEEQVSWYNNFVAYSQTQQSVSMHDSNYYAMPGGFNSSERFTRAAMLKQPAATWNWYEDLALKAVMRSVHDAHRITSHQPLISGLTPGSLGTNL
jgi:penicillin V acylase-like amidase (Ntn superfamily)